MRKKQSIFSKIPTFKNECKITTISIMVFLQSCGPKKENEEIWCLEMYSKFY